MTSSVGMMTFPIYGKLFKIPWFQAPVSTNQVAIVTFAKMEMLTLGESSASTVRTVRALRAAPRIELRGWGWALPSCLLPTECH